MASVKAAGMVCVTVVLFSAAAVRGQEQAGEGPPHERLLAEIRRHDSGLAIWWTGNNGWLIKANGLLIGTDLVLEDSVRERPAPISAAELAGQLDISFVTHVHHDHFNGPTSKVLAEKSRCLFVLPRSCLEMARELGIPEDRIVVARIPGESKRAATVALRCNGGHRAVWIDVTSFLEATMGRRQFLPAFPVPLFLP